MTVLTETFAANRAGKQSGIYSVCSAHPLVLEAALRQGLKDQQTVLIEATANQVNQFGGYTGMKPDKFVAYVNDIALKVGIAKEQIILGGDHLGPTCWTSENADSAMQKSKVLIESYVAAGFKKIHLDTSMECNDDLAPLSDATVAQRAATLCKVAECTAIAHFGSSDLVYVVGTEVPPPGGARHDISQLEVTPVNNVKETIEAHQQAFKNVGLEDAWDRVIALVVQPGVEFDNFSVIPYAPQKAKALSQFISTVPRLVYEAHSTDYQPDSAYKSLVADHFAILKVGPQLTFALREALFALSFIEDALLPAPQRSNLRDVCERLMLEKPGHWDKFYAEQGRDLKVYRQYSFSDRIRYYWNTSEVEQAVLKLFDNLTKLDIPLSLISQFMPVQYSAIMNHGLSVKPKELVLHRIMQVTNTYASACH
jgi:D-tagatose-1,6-bisphosphate aldolase subunit GatZ/KbaZ